MKRVAVAILPAVALAMSARASENGRVVARMIGQIESPTSAVYSVYLATKEEALGGVLVSAWMPPGARFLESVDVPPGVVYEGVASDVIYWTASNIDRDTLLGPLTFRVKVDAGKNLPQVLPFTVLYKTPAAELLEDPGQDAKLEPLAEAGTLAVDQRGTLDASGKNTLVEAGKTGVLYYVPAGALDRPVTLTFRRVALTDVKMPKAGEGLWWCSVYQVTADAQVAVSKPIAFAFPARRPVPVGLSVSTFLSPDGADWTPANQQSNGKEREIGFGPGSAGGFNCYAGLGFTMCRASSFGGLGGFGGFGAFGFKDDPGRGVITGTALSQQFGQQLSPSLIRDGTSNIIAILIGIR